MINENTYLSRLTDIYTFTSDMVFSVNAEYVYQKAHSLGEGVRKIIVDPKLWHGDVPTNDIIQKMIDEVVKKQSAKVGNYKKWILGHGLVMTCTIFDDFLKDLLREILTVNPQFTSWSNLPEILADFEKKTIDKKYKIFTNKLNFSDEEFFDFSIFNTTIQKRLEGVDITRLNEIYGKRNKAAHSDSYVLSTVEELADISMIFEKLIWNLSIKCREKWQVKSEFIGIISAVHDKNAK